jgi:endonuclease-3 related protein
MPTFAASRQFGALTATPEVLVAAGRQTLPPNTLLSPYDPKTNLLEYYDALLAAYGPQGWWPGRTRFEVIAGAILVQNTAWTNAALAIRNLRRERLHTAEAIERISLTRLAWLVRPSGYFRQKARKLKAFAQFLRRTYQGSLTRMFCAPTAVLREQLLEIHGIGPETADAILLYAGGHPVFVVDAYARRMLSRHGLIAARDANRAPYEKLRNLFENALPRDPALYNEFHALIVHVGKHFCRARNPRCGDCALRSLMPQHAQREQHGRCDQEQVANIG